MKTSHVIAAAASAFWLFGSMSALAQHATGVKQACTPDVQRLCPGAVPGKGWIMQCLKGRMSEVSPDCKNAIDTARANRAARKAAAAAAASPAPPAPGAPH